MRYSLLFSSYNAARVQANKQLDAQPPANVMLLKLPDNLWEVVVPNYRAVVAPDAQDFVDGWEHGDYLKGGMLAS